MTFSSLNPSSLEIIWEGHMTTKQELEKIVSLSKQTYQTWRLTPLQERIALLRNYAALLKKKQTLLTTAISQETGKPLWDAKAEVEAMIGKIEISIQAFFERSSTKTTPLAQVTAKTSHKPHGLAAVFGPFNFPGHLPNGHIVPALLAGNTIIFKPSELTPYVGELLVNCFNEAGFPKGVIQIAQGGKEVGQVLASHPNIDALFFTGSVKTGELLSKQFAQTPEKLLALELGGNNPLVVYEIEDETASAYLVLQSAFITSGQRCTCARRLIVVDLPKNRSFIEKLLSMTKSLKIGSYLDTPEPFMGPVIDLTAKNRLLEGQKFLIQQGATPLLTMQSLEKVGFFLTPGIIDVTHLPSKPDIEWFGPLLQISFVPDFQTAIDEANRTTFGLAAGLLTQQESDYHLFFEQVNAGIINWNTPLTGALSTAPFGGIGKSGNFRPSAFYAADYCSYPVASLQNPHPLLPHTPLPGICLL